MDGMSLFVLSLSRFRFIPSSVAGEYAAYAGPVRRGETDLLWEAICIFLLCYCFLN